MNESRPTPHDPSLPQPGDELLRLRQQLQSARLELEARSRSLQTLSAELEALRARQDERARESAGNQLESVLKDAAVPAAQLVAQAYLLEQQGKPVQARDILNVARRLLRALEKHGLVLEGQPGAQVSFDPDRHSPLSAETQLDRDQPVVVRFPGVSFGGKVLVRAAVERLEETP
jgi:molecular chaperone GrpE (heat shock protein)